MTRPLRIEYAGAFYHVTSRGNEQKDVFKSQKDREKFLDYLASATERYGAVSSIMGENEKLARQVGMYLCHRHSGKKLKEIGALFGVGETAIAEARRLLSRKLKEDRQLAKIIETVSCQLKI
jgi:hypothetical protein